MEGVLGSDTEGPGELGVGKGLARWGCWGKENRQQRGATVCRGVLGTWATSHLFKEI